MPDTSDTTLNFLTASSVLLSTLMAEYTILELPSPMISPCLHLMICPYSTGSVCCCIWLPKRGFDWLS